MPMPTTAVGQFTADASQSPPPYEPNLSGHMPALDALRGIAILLVMMLHFAPSTVAPASGPGRIIFRLIDGGSVGVDLFFVLSGFLITGILFDAKGTSRYFQNFYARRVLRIFPLYYALLLVIFVVLPRLKPPNEAGMLDLYHHQAWFWLYGTNFWVAWTGHWPSAGWMELSQIWSLAVEEHFYLVWPAVIFMLGRKGAMRFCVACIGVAVGCRVGCYLYEMHSSAQVYAGFVLTPCRMDSLALGGWIALACRGPGGVPALLPWARLAAFLGGFYMIFNFLVYPRVDGFIMRTCGYTFFALCLGGVLLMAVAANPVTLWGRFFRLAPLRSIGKYSYGMYLLHVSCRPFLDHFFTLHKMVSWFQSFATGVLGYIVTATAVTYALAFLSWHLYEKHFLKLKRFFAYRGAKPDRN